MLNLLGSTAYYEILWILSNHIYIINIFIFLISLFFVYQYFCLKSLDWYKEYLVPDHIYILKNYWKSFLIQSSIIFGLSYLTDIRSIYLIWFALTLIVSLQVPDYTKAKFYFFIFLAIYPLVFAREFYCILYISFIDVFIRACMKSLGYNMKYQIKGVELIYNRIWELACLITLNLKSVEYLWFRLKQTLKQTSKRLKNQSKKKLKQKELERKKLLSKKKLNKKNQKGNHVKRKVIIEGL